MDYYFNNSSLNPDSVFIFKEQEIYEILKFIGINGSIITFIITCIAIYPSIFYIIAFIVGWGVNYQINKILKNIFKEPRPVEIKPSNSFHERDIIKETWGFPSGHAQIIIYAFIFLLLLKPKKIKIIILLVIILFISIFQRYIYNKHTVTQLIAGLFIGTIFTFFYFLLITLMKPYTQIYNF